jgi:hypothetical protein
MSEVRARQLYIIPSFQESHVASIPSLPGAQPQQT